MVNRQDEQNFLRSDNKETRNDSDGKFYTRKTKAKNISHTFSQNLYLNMFLIALELVR